MFLEGKDYLNIWEIGHRWSGFDPEAIGTSWQHTPGKPMSLSGIPMVGYRSQLFTELRGEGEFNRHSDAEVTDITDYSLNRYGFSIATESSRLLCGY
jgi:hypothetical protein